MNEAPLNWPVDFLERAVTIYDYPADSYLVWLVDFECKIATTGDPSTYANQEWETFDKPSAEKFIEFLNAQRPQSEEAKISQNAVAMFADYQKQQLLQQARQKIASEQLAAVVIADAAVWAKDANAWMSPDAMVKKAVGLTDLLLKELQDSTD